MILIHGVRLVLFQFGIGTSLAIVSLLLCHQSFAESTMPPIDDRCERLKSILSFQERAFRPCYNELDICVEERTAQIAEPHSQAEDYCWSRPISIDPRFQGPCPEYMSELESNKIDNNHLLLQRIWLRSFFTQWNDDGQHIGELKSAETEHEIRRILSTDPDNPRALEVLIWEYLDRDDFVSYLYLSLSEHERDPDCPDTQGMFISTTGSFTENVVDGWLAGKGSGSELSKAEMKELFLRIQQTLLDSYDLAIEQSEKEEKLRWALASLHNGILSRSSENVQQFADLIEAGLDDYVEKRSASLIQHFSREYDVDSQHGRSETLLVSCSDFAFELGLLDHCLKLLTYFAQEDSDSLDSPALDWTRAAISVMNALTRDCSPEEWTPYGPAWWSDRRCLAEHHTSLALNINEMQRKFLSYEPSAETEVLQAYLHLNESSDERFLRALEMNDAMVVYAAPLSKRLHRMGYLGTATNILSGIDVEIEGNLTSREKQLLSRTSSSVLEGRYKNWPELPADS